MNRPFKMGPEDTLAARAGRAASVVLDLACKGAVAVVGLAIFLGMRAPRHVVPESREPLGRPRIEAAEHGGTFLVFPQIVKGQGVSRLVLHDPSGRETCVVEYFPSGPLFLFGREGHPAGMGLRMTLRGTANGGISWNAVSRASTTRVDLSPGGVTDVVVIDNRASGSELGRVRIPPGEKPRFVTDAP